MRKLFLLCTISALLLSASCSKYLDVEPKSSMSENEIFRSQIGFEQALVGIYSQISKQELYGERLSLGMVAALAQDYNQNSVGAPYYQTRTYKYDNDDVRNYLLQIWSAGYNAIAGLNMIIEKTETNKSVLTSTAYQQIRGEALALRGYIHFDLYRLFGPEYQSGKTAKAIPYETQINAFANIPSTSEVFCQSVLQDLAQAAELLKAVDPIVASKEALGSRRIKMNYYAVKGLEARVQLYTGNKTAAAAAAQEVVDATVFPFVSISSVNANASSKDRLFIPELIFALRSRNMLTWTENYFKFFRSSGMGLTRSLANINTIYESSTTDIRRLYLFEEDKSILYPSKFWQTYVPAVNEGLTSVNRKDQLIPLIRISEMYYILAETANTAQEGIVQLNKVRTARALSKLPETQTTTETFLNNEIRKEYQKEFYAEGQFFFYLKRKNVVRPPFMTSDVPLSVYKLPIPDVELEYNPTYQ